jgi:hypothetical protein
LQQALDSLLHSKVWKTALRADEVEVLTRQIEPGPNVAANEETLGPNTETGTAAPPALDLASMVKPGSSVTEAATAYARLTHRTLLMPAPLPAGTVLLSPRPHFSDQASWTTAQVSQVLRIVLTLNDVALADSPDGIQVTATADPTAAAAYLKLAGPATEDRLQPLLAALRRENVTVTAPNATVGNAAAWLARNLDCYVLLAPGLPDVRINVHTDVVPLADVVAVASGSTAAVPATADDMDYDAFPQSFTKPRPAFPQDWNALMQAKQAALLDPAVAAAMQKFKESLQTADQVMRATIGKDPATKQLLDWHGSLELVTGINANAVPAQPPLGLGYRVEPPPPPAEPDGSTRKRPDQMTPEEIMNREHEATTLYRVRDQALKDPAVAAAILKAREAYH